MKTLKTVTIVECKVSFLTASMILPLKMNILDSMAESDDDSPAVRDVKKAIRNDLEQRYTDPALQNYHSTESLWSTHHRDCVKQ